MKHPKTTIAGLAGGLTMITSAFEGGFSHIDWSKLIGGLATIAIGFFASDAAAS